jgi:hypothetical protein
MQKRIEYEKEVKAYVKREQQSIKLLQQANKPTMTNLVNGKVFRNIIIKNGPETQKSSAESS